MLENKRTNEKKNERKLKKVTNIYSLLFDKELLMFTYIHTLYFECVCSIWHIELDGKLVCISTYQKASHTALLYYKENAAKSQTFYRETKTYSIFKRVSMCLLEFLL